MWRRIKDSGHFMSFKKEVGYEISVTDYTTLWHSYFSASSFIQCLKDSNAKLEMSEEILVQKALSILSNPEDIKSATFKTEHSGLDLTLTKSYGYCFLIKMNLTQGSKELFFQKVTQPILKIIQDLSSSQTELRELLIKKDNAIEEYKLEAGELAVYLKTDKFDEDKFLSKHQSYKNYFGSEDIPRTLSHKVAVAPEDAIKRESNESCSSIGNSATNDSKTFIKTEPTLQSLKTTNSHDIDEVTNVKQENDGIVRQENDVKVKQENDVTMKQENDVAVKQELQIFSNPRKRIKKLNL